MIILQQIQIFLLEIESDLILNVKVIKVDIIKEKEEIKNKIIHYHDQKANLINAIENKGNFNINEEEDQEVEKVILIKENLVKEEKIVAKKTIIKIKKVERIENQKLKEKLILIISNIQQNFTTNLIKIKLNRNEFENKRNKKTFK